ncbi:MULTISPECIES: 3'(2'),5'-bisphosphate nucleotidase CysQ [Arthrobacter]|uniref:3'(2'),5'-bisphosphate nucleotidase CysQ n=1 Tax=Arthrobacter TaxID=1663 RepID=UPI0009E8B184|nr:MULTISPECIES: 3'(2'),5'-bisphosphate nucleotidase CysQ [Arthrobacter]
MDIQTSICETADLDIDHATDQVLAESVAWHAGESLRRLQSWAIHHGVGSGKLKDDGDRTSQEFIAAVLGRLRPGDDILSEEGLDSRDRLSARRVWIIDPLDGTREFSEGRPDWAVHVALWEDGALAAGAVALPSAGRVIGACIKQVDFAPPENQKLRIAVSRSRAPEVAERVAGELNAELVPMGSAGFKTWAVVDGQVDAYLHAGGQYEWDSAAPVFAAQSAGLHASRIDGSALTYNEPVPYLPDLLICRVADSPLLLGAIKNATVNCTESTKTSAERTLP